MKRILCGKQVERRLHKSTEINMKQICAQKRCKKRERERKENLCSLLERRKNRRWGYGDLLILLETKAQNPSKKNVVSFFT